MGVSIELLYKGDLICEAAHGPSKKKLLTDAPLDNGGKGSEFSPTDLVAASLPACMLTIMGIVAKQNGLSIEGTRASVVKEMVQKPVRRIGKLAVKIVFPKNLKFSAADRAKLENGAQTCPVKGSLHPDVKIETEFIYET